MKQVNIYTYSTAKSPKAAKSQCEAVGFVIEYQDKQDKAFSQMKIIPLSVLHQMIVLLCRLMNDKEFCNYDSSYCEAALKRWEPVYDIFVRYGWYFTEEEQQLLDGTHELYERKSEN